MATRNSYRIGFFGQLFPSLSHFVQDHALPLHLGLFSFAFLRKVSVLSSRLHGGPTPSREGGLFGYFAVIA